MIQLAQELIDLVVDQISFHGEQNIRRSPQRRIFESVADLSTPSRPMRRTRALDLLNVLDSSPRLVLYVRNLTISLSRQDGPVHAVLPLLRNVERLRILGFQLVWPDIPDAVRTAVEYAISQPALQELYLCGDYKIEVPLFLMLLVMSSFRLLSLVHVMVYPKDCLLEMIPDHATPAAARLQHLNCRPCENSWLSLPTGGTNIAN
ncbi:hypothetical protein C8J57DRAFT_1707111 [Mycena rebaudengoi]|jgi:hypothetical protein|nr:hypothetical protein C8J57DRAFT_1707111 [Mycena rebaudengoi]